MAGKIFLKKNSKNVFKNKIVHNKHNKRSIDRVVLVKRVLRCFEWWEAHPAMMDKRTRENVRNY